MEYIACQAPPPTGFSKQEYWSGLPSPSLGALPDPGIEPGSLALQADSLPLSLGEAHVIMCPCTNTIDHISYAVYSIPMAYLFYNRKFVPPNFLYQRVSC